MTVNGKTFLQQNPEQRKHTEIRNTVYMPEDKSGSSKLASRLTLAHLQKS